MARIVPVVRTPWAGGVMPVSDECDDGGDQAPEDQRR